MSVWVRLLHSLDEYMNKNATKDVLRAVGDAYKTLIFHKDTPAVADKIDIVSNMQ